MADDRHAAVGDPVGQRCGEGIAVGDWDPLVLAAVKEQDRKLEVIAMLERVEAVPVGAILASMAPSTGSAKRPGRSISSALNSITERQSSTGASSTRAATPGRGNRAARRAAA
jgi:hypothetical protein